MTEAVTRTFFQTFEAALRGDHDGHYGDPAMAERLTAKEIRKYRAARTETAGRLVQETGESGVVDL